LLAPFGITHDYTDKAGVYRSPKSFVDQANTTHI
jgi:hypothetical protein